MLRIFTNLNQLRIGSQSWTTDFQDFDNDGDQDVVAFINTEVATSPTTFQYFINNGGGVFANGFIIGESGPNGQEVHAVDFDNDGDTDVLYAEGSDDEVGWIENLGSGTWGTPVVFDNTGEWCTIIDRCRF